jgi:prepilin-type N-terminal cleavage/methylation domain-containing protein
MVTRFAGAQRRAGFTLIELLVVLAVIFLLISLLIGGFRFSRRFAKRSADRVAVSSLVEGISFFEQQMGTGVPLVKDFGGPPPVQSGLPIVASNGQNRPNIYQITSAPDLQFLRTSPPADQPDWRFSIYSFAYYIVGGCEVPRLQAPPNGQVVAPMDGVAGPGMFAMKRDGTFERTGKRFDPFFDTSRNAKALVAVDPTNGRFELRDSGGVAYRFYRWEHGDPSTGQVQNIDDLNIPRILGLPSENAALKGAKWAIVAAGPDGVFGNEDQIYAVASWHPQAMKIEDMAAKLGMSTPPGPTGPEADKLRAKAMEDNIVEVGK